jgi:hypothetical protein
MQSEKEKQQLGIPNLEQIIPKLFLDFYSTLSPHSSIVWTPGDWNFESTAITDVLLDMR